MDNRLDKVDTMDNFIRTGEPWNKTETYPGLITSIEIDTHTLELKICSENVEQLFQLLDVEEIFVRVNNLLIVWENGRKDKTLNHWYRVFMNEKIITLIDEETNQRFPDLGKLKLHVDEIKGFKGTT